MPNPLTGDFEAVLQVSDGTMNRLLASMHQNAFADLKRPSFPHAVWLRLGDPEMIDGVRGILQVQIAVPRLGLVHGATDRFLLEVGIRARYRPDPGTEPLPAFIHGTVSAEYVIHDIDPSCPGWAKLAADYLWVRVVKGSVRFRGTAREDRSLLVVSGPPADAAATEAKITRQVAVLLATRFEATPHRVTKRFRRGRLRSLKAPSRGSAVALPLALDGGDPVGQIASIDNLLLEGADFAIGVRREYILSLAEPALDAIREFKTTAYVHVDIWGAPDIDTVYRVRANPGTVEWHPHGSFAVIKLKASGNAETDSVLPDVTFDIEQDITLNFDAAGGLWLAPGSRQVTTHASGLGSWEITDKVNGAVHDALKDIVKTACADAQSSLDAVTGRTADLVEQLQTIDAQASAGLTQAVFLSDGLVLRGRIALTPRHAPVTAFEKTVEQDGHSAFASWIPGGRIDAFEWSWSWDGAREPGAATHDDRFVLRRPVGTGKSRWGIVLNPETPLPGLDGTGSVCLRLEGVHVDDVTGELVPVTATRRCTRFGLNIAVRPQPHGGRLFLRDVPELAQDVPFPELALRAVGTTRDPEPTSNTLLLHCDEAWDEETAGALRGGLEACRRHDAGLVLVVLFRDGSLAAAGSRLVREVEELAERLGVPAVVNEDVRGGWAASLAIEHRGGRPAWRLLSPGGGVTWMHQGRLAPEALATALDRHLIRCRPAIPRPLRPGVDLGVQVSAAALQPGIAGLIQRPCPPIPLGRLVAESVVSFVQRDSASSTAQLRELSHRYGQRADGGPLVVVVVDGADAREADALKAELGLEFATLPDPAGRITDRFGIRAWPTTLTLDRTGTVTAVETGLGARRGAAGEAGEPTEARE